MLILPYSEGPVGPMGVLSLTQLKTLPLEQQIIKLLKNGITHIIVYYIRLFRVQKLFWSMNT